MAGLAGALNAPGRIHALQDALAPRGADAATLHLDGFDGAELDLAVRSALPAIPRVVSDAGTDHARIVAGLAVDGIASVTALDGGYATHGPAGLFDGDLPYAVVLADAERDCLVLARNGDGPTLYYARYGDGWLAASEPAALLQAGVPADPDPETIVRFVQTGACDDTRRTFLHGVWRVRSGEAVVLADGASEFVGEPTPAVLREVDVALETAVGDGRVGVLLGPGRPGAAVLGAALARADRLRPLPVHTVTFTDLRAEAGRVPGLLVSLSLDLVRHMPHPLQARGLDLDTFLSEIGEPVPDLQLYLLWAVARTLDGEIDVLVDSAAGDPAVVSRVRDRIEARYGVAVRTPMRDTGPVDEGALQSLVDGSLPPMAARGAAIDLARPPTAADVLLADLDAVAAAVARRRSWLDRTASIDALRRLSAGEPADAEALLRAYLVERWLDTLPQPDADLDPVAAIEGEPAEAPVSPAPVGSARLPLPPEEIHVDGMTWSRVRVRTEVFVAGDGVPVKVGWHATNALVELTAERTTREALRGPWFAILSGRALAVAQRRVCPLWDIKPGPLARYLARLAQRPLPHLGEAWTMQVALDDCGRAGVALPVLLAQVWPSRAARMLPEAAAALYPPRAGAVPPGDSAVVQGPIQPDRAADALVSAIRYAAPVSLVSTLAGCAVVSADEDGSRLLGFAPGPYVDAVVDAESVVAQLCADNPAGQDHEQTPLVLAYAAPRWRAAEGRDRFDVSINRKSTMDTRPGVESAPVAGEATPSAGETTPSR